VDDLIAKGDVHVIKNNEPQAASSKVAMLSASRTVTGLPLPLLITEKEIILLYIGSHDDVYR